MIPQNELTAHDVRQEMQTIAQAHLPLAAAGYKSTSEMLYDVLMKAASPRTYLRCRYGCSYPLLKS